MVPITRLGAALTFRARAHRFKGSWLIWLFGVCGCIDVLVFFCVWVWVGAFAIFVFAFLFVCPPKKAQRTKVCEIAGTRVSSACASGEPALCHLVCQCFCVRFGLRVSVVAFVCCPACHLNTAERVHAARRVRVAILTYF